MPPAARPAVQPGLPLSPPIVGPAVASPPPPPSVVQTVTIPPAAAITAATPEQERKATEAEARLAALSTADVSQANAVTGIYGDSGTGKTSQEAEAIEYNWEMFHRISRVYASDNGGYGNKLIKLVKLGIAQVWQLRNHVEAFETAEYASLGYWPEKILDPITGYADPHVQLIAPQIRRWTVFCPNGHSVRTVESRRMLDSFQNACPTCQTMVNLTNWSKVEEAVVISPGFKHVGLYIYDSGSAMCDWVMEDMAGRSARGEYVGDKNQLKGTPATLISGSMTFGANSMQHYGFSQLRVASWIANSRRIPRQTVPTIWTFLENRGSDEGNLPIFGPKVSGNAKTAEVPSWVGNCLHLSKSPEGRFRLWTQTHSSPTEGSIPHLAKHRGEPNDIEPMLEDDDPIGRPFEKCSLKYFFVRLEQSLQRSLAVAVDKYPDAPALRPFGDDDQEEVITTAVVSIAAPQAQRMHVPAGLAGVAASGPAMFAPGVPVPPGMASGVPMPPAPAGMPMSTPAGLPMAVPPAGLASVPQAPIAARPPLPTVPAAPVAQPAAVVPPVATVSAPAAPTVPPAVPAAPPIPPAQPAPPPAAVNSPVLAALAAQATARAAQVPSPPVSAPGAPVEPTAVASQPAVAGNSGVPAAPTVSSPMAQSATPAAAGAPVRPPTVPAVVSRPRPTRPPVPPPPGPPGVQGTT